MLYNDLHQGVIPHQLQQQQVTTALWLHVRHSWDFVHLKPNTLDEKSILSALSLVYFMIYQMITVALTWNDPQISQWRTKTIILQFLPEAAQKSLRILRVFHVQRNARVSQVFEVCGHHVRGNSGLIQRIDRKACNTRCMLAEWENRTFQVVA